MGNGSSDESNLALLLLAKTRISFGFCVRPNSKGWIITISTKGREEKFMRKQVFLTIIVATMTTLFTMASATSFVAPHGIFVQADPLKTIIFDVSASNIQTGVLDASQMKVALTVSDGCCVTAAVNDSMAGDMKMKMITKASATVGSAAIFGAVHTVQSLNTLTQHDAANSSFLRATWPAGFY